MRSDLRQKTNHSSTISFLVFLLHFCSPCFAVDRSSRVCLRGHPLGILGANLGFQDFNLEQK